MVQRSLNRKNNIEESRRVEKGGQPRSASREGFGSFLFVTIFLAAVYRSRTKFTVTLTRTIQQSGYSSEDVMEKILCYELQLATASTKAKASSLKVARQSSGPSPSMKGLTLIA